MTQSILKGVVSLVKQEISSVFWCLDLVWVETPFCSKTHPAQFEIALQVHHKYSAGFKKETPHCLAMVKLQRALIFWVELVLQNVRRLSTTLRFKSHVKDNQRQQRRTTADKTVYPGREVTKNSNRVNRSVTKLKVSVTIAQHLHPPFYGTLKENHSTLQSLSWGLDEQVCSMKHPPSTSFCFPTKEHKLSLKYCHLCNFTFITIKYDLLGFHSQVIVSL